MPIAKLTNTSKRPITIKAEGCEYILQPGLVPSGGSNIAANFSDEEWTAAKAARQVAREADDLPDDEPEHLATIERDKAWVVWREENNATAAKAARTR